MKTKTKIILSILSLITILIWISVFSLPDKPNLKLVFCNVGQGDGVLIAKGTVQIIIDGGPNDKILDCISKHVPFWDRKIELVVLTHPHADHLTGLIKIFDQYEVQNYLANEVDLDSTKSYNLLKEKIKNENTKIIKPIIGSYFSFDGVIFKTIAPIESLIDANDLNTYSIVNKLTYGKFTSLLTGDIQEPESDNLSTNNEIENIKILKLPHHGSDHGATDNLLSKVKPEVSVISVGKNSYGHPSNKIIEKLKSLGSKVIRTDEAGDVVIDTNGLWYTIN